MPSRFSGEARLRRNVYVTQLIITAATPIIGELSCLHGSGGDATVFPYMRKVFPTFGYVKHGKILVAEDDLDDQFLLKTAFIENGSHESLDFVEDGTEVLHYLASVDKGINTYPDIIMLDLNMPKMNGKEVLLHIKQHPVFKKIPVVIYTTTKNEVEVKRCYELGANTYIVKPSNFEAMVKVVDSICKYWLATAFIPPLS